MSHHLDSEAARQDPRLDISDVYVFKGDTGTVFVINTNPLSAAGGFHPEARYEFKVDTNGDAVEDLTLRARFMPRDHSGAQDFVLTKLTGAAGGADREAAGETVARGRTGEIIAMPGGLRVWAGSAGDPFFIEGNVVTAVRTAVTTGSRLDLGAYDPATAANLFGDTNVTSIVLEVPEAITGTGMIGFWGTTALPDHHGGWVQVNRAATPLLSTLFDFTADGTVDFNASDPHQDQSRFGRQVHEDVAKLLVANDALSPRQAEFYARYVRVALLPDMLRYEVGTDASFGVKRRNGRGLAEPAPEVMFQLLLNAPVPMGLDARSATGALRDEFPYLGLPV